MADGRSLTTISEADYDVIESAVMETERGRWFLREYARRNRNAETQVLLDAISRLEHAVAANQVAQDVDHLRANLKEMAAAITSLKAEIYTACSFQDLTAQRIAKIIHTLRSMEGRINAMITIWDRTEAVLLRTHPRSNWTSPTSRERPIRTS